MNIIQFPEIGLTRRKLVYKCSSADNEYIPIICLKGAQIFSKDNKKLFIYDFFKHNGTGDMFTYSKYDEVIQEMKGMCWSTIQRAHITENYIMTFGSIFLDTVNVPIPLLLLCAKRRYLFEIDKENPDPNHFCLLVDTKFEKLQVHHHLYINIKKGYINTMAEHLDVVYTKDIKSRCYNSFNIMPKFSTLPLMMEHLKSINNNLK